MWKMAPAGVQQGPPIFSTDTGSCEQQISRMTSPAYMLPNRRSASDSGLESSSSSGTEIDRETARSGDDVAAVEWRHRQLVDVSTEALALML